MCLRVEFCKFNGCGGAISQGIKVSMVNPGAVRTPIWSKSTGQADQLLAEAPPLAGTLYGGLIRQVQAGAAHAEKGGATALQVLTLQWTVVDRIAVSDGP